MLLRAKQIEQESITKERQKGERADGIMRLQDKNISRGMKAVKKI